jgi:NADPH:quinone reductase-like Zn-dependent oxidoreductase
VKRVQEITNGEGVPVVYDGVGQALLLYFPNKGKAIALSLTLSLLSYSF